MSKKQTATKSNNDDTSAIDTDAQQHGSAPTPVKTPPRWPLFTLAFIIGSAASILGLNYYQQHYDLKSFSHPIHNQTIAEPKPATASVSPIPDINKALSSPTMDAAASNTISSEESHALIESIATLQESLQGLQHELQILREQQQSVAHSQSLLESMQLHARLTWIIKDNAHLPQINLAWQEISLLPSLSPEQRIQAEAMLKLAEQRQNDVQQWQQELEHLILSLQPSQYNNIIPSSINNHSNPWLQWLLTQFSLKRSQSSQEAAQLSLKNKLLHIKQAMSLEQWPSGTAWTELRAQLQLRLVQQFSATKKASHEAAQAPSLQLPENFKAIQSDIDKLRQTAKLWLEES